MIPARICTAVDEAKVAAVCKALAILSVDAATRAAMRRVPSPWQTLVRCLKLPATCPAMPHVLSLLANLSSDAVNAQSIAKKHEVVSTLATFLLHSNKDIHSRCGAPVHSTSLKN
jgi:hypothetical protein